jgi:hypothetical protein
MHLPDNGNVCGLRNRQGRDQQDRTGTGIGQQQPGPDPQGKRHVADPVGDLLQQRARDRALVSRPRKVAIEAIQKDRRQNQDGGRQHAAAREADRGANQKRAPAQSQRIRAYPAVQQQRRQMRRNRLERRVERRERG